MRKLVWLGKRNPAHRDLANLICARVKPKDWIGELRAVFNWVRDNIRYSLDTSDIEVLQSAAVTLRLGYGDCDDRCILSAVLLESLGHPCVLFAMGFEPFEAYTHVVVLANGGGETGFVALDTTEPEPMGWLPPGITYSMSTEIPP
jgi:transglutaminase-like putative cysteine protease